MYIIWTIFGIIFLVLDFKKASKIKLSLAGGCLFCAIYAFKFPNNVFIQPIIFAALTVLFYFFVLHIFKKEEADNIKRTKLKDCLGKTAIVTKDIGKTLSVDGIGFIDYNNEIYQAKSIDDKIIKAGQKVIIVSRENLIINVKAV